MTFEPIRLLTANATLQMVAACLLGVAMLVPMQPWAAPLKARVDFKSLGSTHLDWLMLGFMQWGAVLVMQQWPDSAQRWVAVLLVIGGWFNALPYLLRGFGINAFVFAGRPTQRLAAALGGLSSLGLLVAWVTLAVHVLGS